MQTIQPPIMAVFEKSDEIESIGLGVVCHKGIENNIKNSTTLGYNAIYNN